MTKKITATKENIFMKLLPPHLRQEFIRLSKLCPDIEGITSPIINVSDVLRAYFILADYFTDPAISDSEESMEFGIRDRGHLLYSALSRQTISFGSQIKYTEPLEICATLFFGLVKDHAFLDGNKRTALLVLLYQLQLYSYFPSSKISEFETLVIAVAAGDLSKTYQALASKYKNDPDKEVHIIAKKLKSITKKKDNTYHNSPTLQEFCTSLETITNLDVQYFLDNGKVKFERKVRHLLTTKTLTFSIKNGGMTRAVGAKTARDVLKNLDIYQEYASYSDLFQGKEPMYMLVDKFNAPLRRLKDK